MDAACDVAVLGSGPAGCATAIALARHGVSGVRLVAPPHRRTIAIGETLLPDTGILLERLGVWDRFRDEGHEPCLGSCSAWGSDAVGYNDFLLNVRGNGWHLDRERFDAFLLDEAQAAGATVLRGARFAAVETETPDGVQLRLAHPERGTSSLLARFVVDATGARGAFAASRGASRTERSQLMFVYGFFDAGDESSPLRLTLIEATETGWWYAAGLPNGRVAVAFASDPDVVREAGMARRERWLPALLRTRHVAGRLDGCRLLPDLVARVAPSGLSDPVCGERWLAVGDAAASFDPLSGEGIHKAISNGLDAAPAIALALTSDSTQLAAYDAMVADRFHACRAELDGFYAAEARWPAAPFWRRRSERADPARSAVAG